ncbi:general substrate transporter [Xylariales sp. PMI_506]|nr:general substrate transporter [Xylariales sp. PMI_506]
MGIIKLKAPLVWAQTEGRELLGKGTSSDADSYDLAKHGTSRNAVLVCVTAALGGFLYGFSGNAMSGTLAQTSFIADFLSGDDALQREDGLFGGFLSGAMLGTVIQAPISNKYGRRIANLSAAIVCIIAGALIAGSVNYAMLCLFRTLNGIGAGMVIANSPVYMSEVAPPQARGLLVGLQGVGIVFAYIICSLVGLTFSFVETSYQWRLTFVVLTAASVAHMCSLYFLPESPRWLMQKGRVEEAKAILEKLHRTDSDPDATLAHAEAIQIQAQVEAEKSLPHGYVHIFTTPHLLKRAFCSIILWVMGQGTGITAIANLVPTLMGGLGFGTTMQLGLGVVWCVCAIIGCGINVLILDRVGRVRLLVIGGFGSVAILSLMAALIKFYLGSDNLAGVNAAVAFYFIFGAFFTSTIECTSYVYGSEIWPTHLRSEGSTIAYASFFGNALAYSAPVSVALNNIGWKFYLVFVAVTFVSTLVIMFYFPETKNLTLEEINVKFGDTVAIDLKDAVAAEKHGVPIVAETK